MDEAFGVKGPGGLQGTSALSQHIRCSVMMDIIGGEHRDPGMAVLGVVPGEERPAEGDGGGNVFEAAREYAGSKTVKVYSPGDITDDTETVSGTKVGYLTIEDEEVEGDEVNNVALKSVGTYYPAGTDDNTLEVAVELTELGVPQGDFVAEGAKGKEVFSYTDPTDDMKKYVVATNRVVRDTATTYNYVNAAIHVVLDADGDPDTTDMHEVTAKIPEGTEYKHIHFGAWAALGDPEKDGTQEHSDLGIGFVQSIGDGLTGTDMPNNGNATYSGNWAAAVQAADEDGDGDILLVNGAATLDADLSKATIDVNLMGLAELEGAIDTNTFSGTKATVGANDHSLTADAKFTGSFSGGFYGKQAAEAGGIFDFTSEDAEAGAFRGAFGGNRD